jgi:hypothetical protein
MMSYGDSPVAEKTPPVWRKKIIHATYNLGEHVLTGADAAPGTHQKPQGFSVALGEFGTPWVINCEKAGLTVETSYCATFVPSEILGNF